MKKPGTRLILSWLHGFLLNCPQVKNLTCSQPVSSVQNSSPTLGMTMPVHRFLASCFRACVRFYLLRLLPCWHLNHARVAHLYLGVAVHEILCEERFERGLKRDRCLFVLEAMSLSAFDD
jgi:hypothetical protein